MGASPVRRKTWPGFLPRLPYPASRLPQAPPVTSPLHFPREFVQQCAITLSVTETSYTHTHTHVSQHMHACAHFLGPQFPLLYLKGWKSGRWCG